ncbi:MAG: dihydrofolate reductase family protein [Bacteroidota bacterium]|nr:dihydrofolate reductase family protein [Bacteroidota bacterium]
MKNIISFMHVSLDGFVAGPNGEMNWIKVDEEIFDQVGRRVSESDTALYGRVTYEMMENYWPAAGEAPDASKHDREHSAWYNQAKKIVLSHTLKGAVLKNTTIISDHLSDNLRNLQQTEDGGGKEILLFGSPSATHSLMQLDLIDGYWLFVNPIILGKGIPLFSGIKDKINLRLLSTQEFSCGVTALDYLVDRK